jgi:prepilin peptidase CpaA
MNADVLLGFDALAVAMTGAVVDVKEHRIPNWLTYPVILLGLLLRGCFLGWRGLGSGVAGCLLAGGIVCVFYLVRAMGAGDVKLLAAIGSLVGPRNAVNVLVATAIAGGVLALVYVFARRRFGATLRNLGAVVLFHSWSGLKAHPEFNLDNPSALRMPYGLAIATGTLCAFLAIWWR